MCDSIYMKFNNRKNESLGIDVRWQLISVGLLIGRVHKRAFMNVRNILHFNPSGDNMDVCI